MNFVIFDRSSDLRIVPYLLGDADHTGAPRDAKPELLAGSVEAFESSLSMSPYSQKYISGALSWSEDLAEVGFEKPRAIAIELANILCAGQPDEEMAELIVGHRRKRGFDIHLAKMKSHRSSGRQFPIFSNTKLEWSILRSWRRLTNLRNGWSDPADPWLRDLRSRPSRYLKGVARQEFEQIDNVVTELVFSGAARSRAEVVKMLQQLSYQVRATPTCLEIHNDDKSLKFYGAKYRERTNYAELTRYRREAVRPTAVEVADEIARLDSRLAADFASRASELGRRFKAGVFEFPIRVEAQLRESAGRILPTAERATVQKSSLPAPDDLAKVARVPEALEAASLADGGPGVATATFRPSGYGGAAGDNCLGRDQFATRGSLPSSGTVAPASEQSGAGKNQPGAGSAPENHRAEHGGITAGPTPHQPVWRSDRESTVEPVPAPANGEWHATGQLDRFGNQEAISDENEVFQGIGNALRGLRATLQDVAIAADRAVEIGRVEHKAASRFGSANRSLGKAVAHILVADGNQGHEGGDPSAQADGESVNAAFEHVVTALIAEVARLVAAEGATTTQSATGSLRPIPMPQLGAHVANGPSL